MVQKEGEITVKSSYHGKVKIHIEEGANQAAVIKITKKDEKTYLLFYPAEASVFNSFQQKVKQRECYGRPSVSSSSFCTIFPLKVKIGIRMNIQFRGALVRRHRPRRICTKYK